MIYFIESPKFRFNYFQILVNVITRFLKFASSMRGITFILQHQLPRNCFVCCSWINTGNIRQMKYCARSWKIAARACPVSFRKFNLSHYPFYKTTPWSPVKRRFVASAIRLIRSVTSIADHATVGDKTPWKKKMVAFSFDYWNFSQ